MIDLLEAMRRCLESDNTALIYGNGHIKKPASPFAFHARVTPTGDDLKWLADVGFGKLVINKMLLRPCERPEMPKADFSLVSIACVERVCGRLRPSNKEAGSLRP